MAIPVARIEELVIARGYHLVHKTARKRAYQRGQGQPIYLNLSTSSGENTLLLHPAIPIADLTAGVANVRTDDDYYHSSNLKHFPKRIHTGEKPVGYSWGLTFDTEAAVEELLSRLDGGPFSSPVDERATPHEVANPAETPHRPGADKVASVKRRIGQGDFRGAMLEYWGSCAVTGVQAPRLLRASHIKPWKDGTPDEKTDPFNGLLLAAHLDAAFDAGLISFGDTGVLMISSELTESDCGRLGLTESARLREIDDRHLPYLQFHRSNIFRP